MKINMRNSQTEEKGNVDAPQQQLNSGSPASTVPSTKIRIAIFGQHEVGKTALTVRYLTRRYIGEYKSNSDLLYRQTITMNNTTLDVEMVDISTATLSDEGVSCRKSFPLEEIQRADGFIIVYSITDRSSFQFAAETVETITNYFNHMIPGSKNLLSAPSSGSSSSNSSPNGSPQPRATCPILLLGNKVDLEHLRVVDKVEGLSVSMQYGTHFHELSVAENSPEVYSSIISLISSFIQNKERTKRKFSVSKMLGNLRIGRTSPLLNVIASQASVVDINVLENQNTLTAADDSQVNPKANGVSQPQLKNKLVELHEMNKRHNSPTIWSL